MRTITIPAVNKVVSLQGYIKAVKYAKAHPDRHFDHGLTTWWSVTGKEIMRQFLSGVHDRINQAIPYNKRGER